MVVYGDLIVKAVACRCRIYDSAPWRSRGMLLLHCFVLVGACRCTCMLGSSGCFFLARPCDTHKKSRPTSAATNSDVAHTRQTAGGTRESRELESSCTWSLYLCTELALSHTELALCMHGEEHIICLLLTPERDPSRVRSHPQPTDTDPPAQTGPRPAAPYYFISYHPRPPAAHCNLRLG